MSIRRKKSEWEKQQTRKIAARRAAATRSAKADWKKMNPGEELSPHWTTRRIEEDLKASIFNRVAVHRKKSPVDPKRWMDADEYRNMMFSRKYGTHRTQSQTGKTNEKIDKKRFAKKPGKRVSKTRKTYYERRKNRSDAVPDLRL